MAIGSWLGRVASVLGPGIIIASVALGPGSVTTASKIGSLFGYQLIWVVVLASTAMMTYTVLGARFGVTHRESMLTIIAQHYGRWLSVVIGVSAFLMAASFQFGNNLGVAAAASGVVGPGIDERAWPFIFTGISLAFVLLAPNLYTLIERLMGFLVLVMITAFLANLVYAGPDLLAALRGLVPSVPEDPATTGVGGGAGEIDVLVTMAGLVGTTFVVHACIYQSYLVQQKGWDETRLVRGVRDSVVGIGILALITILITMTSAAALRPEGLVIRDAGDMARQLEALFGRWSLVIFCAGLWAAAFSSISVNAIIGGGLLADSLGLGRSMNQAWPRAFTILIMIVGMVIAAFVMSDRFNKANALVLAQAATMLAAPSVVISLFLVSNSRAIMGDRVNGPWLKGLSALTLPLVLVMSLATYTELSKQLAKVQSPPRGEAIDRVPEAQGTSNSDDLANRPGANSDVPEVTDPAVEANAAN